MSDPVAAQPAGRASRRITAVGLATLAALALAIGWAPKWGGRVQSAWFDAYQVMWPRELTSTPATVVEVDEASLARLGQWPWPRTVLADLVRAVQSHDPAAIGIDVLMPEPDRLSPERLLAATRRSDAVLAQRLDALASNDTVLAQAIAAGPVVLGLAGTLERTNGVLRAPPVILVDRSADAGTQPSHAGLPHFPGAMSNLDVLDRAAAGHGALSAGPGDDAIRRLPLAIGVADRIVPALSIELIRVALGVPDIRIHARGPVVEAVAVGDFVVPTEADGSLRLYYAPRDARRRVSAIDVLEGRVDPERLQRKLVLIGATGLALVDYQNTPLGQRMPGSEIHAQVLENLYDHSWLTRPSWARPLEVALFAVLGLGLIVVTPRLRPATAAMLALAGAAVPVLAGLGAFLAWRLVFDAVVPALALLILFGVLLVLALSDAARVRQALQRDLQYQREQAAYTAGELEAAKRVQMGFLPVPGSVGDGRVEIAATMRPARVVGGDLYDFFLLDGNRLFFLVGDVAGKGLSAGLFMAVGKSVYKTIALRTPHAAIGELMRIANEEVARDNAELYFVTAFAGILDLASGELAYCNAGHENPYVLDASQAECGRLTDAAGPPLCAVDRFAYPSGRRALRPGAVVCLSTDGVIDAQNRRGERYGAERLRAVMGRLQREAKPAQGIVETVCADVAAFAEDTEPYDDITVVAIRWLGPCVLAP